MKQAYKALSTLLAFSSLVSLLGGCAFFGGSKVEQTPFEASVQSMTTEELVIYVDSAPDKIFFLEVMEKLEEEGAFAFTMEGGMLTSLNGKQNPADWSACWMLYTSDTELSDDAFGTYTYQEMEMGSAVVGAEKLPVKAGEYYVWYYQKF